MTPRIRRWLWLVPALLISLSASPALAPTAHAAGTTLPVTDCTSASQLQAALTTANTDNAGDIIDITCTGAVSPTIDLSGGGLSISGTMTIQGDDPGQHVTLSGGNTVQVINVGANGNLTLDNLTITGGTAKNATSGGGIANNGTVTISNSTLSANIANGSGGGIANFTGGTMTISNSTISSNSSSGPGGGIANLGTMSISNSTISANTSATSSGGGIVNNGTVTISNSTLSGNSANGSGGGIANFIGGMTISNSTISGNSALLNGSGGGIYNTVPVQLMGSIVAGNQATTSPYNCAGAIIDNGYNLSNTADCTFVTPTSLQNIDPQLAALASNGGPTQTMALQASSPAIDVIPTSSGNCPATDQRGSTRPDNAEATCDIGAYEFADPVTVDSDLALTNVPQNITVNATSSAGAQVTYATPTATDETGDTSTATVSCTPASGSTFPIGATTVTCTAIDSDDTNSPVTASFTVTVNDTDLALSGMPAPITVDATSPTGAAVSFTPPTATDEGSETTTMPVTCASTTGLVSGSTFPIGITTVTCTANDSDDTPSTVSAAFTVTVNDTDLALTNVPQDITVNSTNSMGTMVTYTPPTATDEPGDTTTATVTCASSPTANLTSGSTFPIGVTTITCTASDSDDLNSGQITASFTVTVNDTDLGLSGMPNDMTVNATSSAGAKVTYNSPTAGDETGDTSTASVSCASSPTTGLVSGSTFPIGVTTITCTASDSDDTPNSVSATFTITVNDTDLALANVPQDMSVNATSTSGAVVSFTPATATDEAGDTPNTASVACSSTSNLTSGSLFPVGVTTVTCTASDSDDAPSTVTATFKVTVNIDNDLGLNHVPNPISVNAATSAGAVVTYMTPTATDEASDPADTTPAAVTCASSPTTGLTSGSTFPIGVTTITCTASDSDDLNSGQITASFTVTVNDTDLALHSVPTEITVDATSTAGAVVTYTPPTATDEAADTTTPTVTCASASGSTFPIGVTTVTCTATDADETASPSATFKVTVMGPVNTGAQTVGFWQNKAGQGIITDSCLGTSGSSLVSFLRQYAPFQDLSGTATCSQAATYVYNVIKAGNVSGGTMSALLKSQMLATALNAYFSDPSLGGAKLSAPTPIGSVKVDLTYICGTVNLSTTPLCGGGVENTSGAFGGATIMTVSQMLTYAASKSNVGGTTWYANTKTTEKLARDAFLAVNGQSAFVS